MCMGKVVGVEEEDVVVEAIARFDNWDARECAVMNAEVWKDVAREYVERLGGSCVIPQVIHQIWVGPREPPCVWLDSWRVEYVKEFPKWEHKLWDNESVEKLEMINRDLYDREGSYQCKADILRLELLWKFGGVYVDADMLHIAGKNLDDILEKGSDTGFVITYEPDTKDKPYSVLGNSLIAVTPRHPITLMLIKYIRAIYDHKRPYHGVEWVTGPLAFTKCLIHTNMPISIPSSHLLYPMFHYVPNPDAIDPSAFPESYTYQFGYTCSGLEGWVKANNRCRRAGSCAYHKKKMDWPLGGLLTFPEGSNGLHTDAKTSSVVPKVIHQFSLAVGEGFSGPARWMETWSSSFMRFHPGWEHRVWTLSSLKDLGESWFCSNVYRTDRPMDELAISLLALEVLFKFGGVYIPTTTIWRGKSEESFFGHVESSGFSANIKGTGITASPAGDMICLRRIQEVLEGDEPPVACEVGPSIDPTVATMGYSDSSASYVKFPLWTRFLAAEEIYDLSGSLACEDALLSWGYDSQVPVYKALKNFPQSIRKSSCRSILVTSEELCRLRSLRDALPGLIANVDSECANWDAIIISAEWECGVDQTEHYKLTSGIFSETTALLGCVLNFGKSAALVSLDVTSPKELLEAICSRHDSLQIYCATQKMAHNQEMSMLYSSMGTIKDAFSKLAGHDAPFDYKWSETHGTLLKGFRDEGQIAMEMTADTSGRVMYRSWNEDGGITCEMKLFRGMKSDTIEWARIYFNHSVVREWNNKVL